MRIYRGTSYDHRLADASDEAYVCEVFGSSRDEVLGWLREQVRQNLAQPEDRDDLQFPAVAVDDATPVEVFVDQIELADLPARKLAIACLNRRGWMKKDPAREVLWLDRNGRALPGGRRDPD